MVKIFDRIALVVAMLAGVWLIFQDKPDWAACAIGLAVLFKMDVDRAS